MFTLTPDTIALHAHATDKQDAIRKAGELLVKGGRVLPGYVEDMLAREASMSTSMNNGVAIPHGKDPNVPCVLRTGISVLQLEEAVPWDEDETVSLVIGIAALAGEHIGVLTNLSEVIEDEAKLDELLHTADPQVVMAYLNPPAEAEDAPGPAEPVPESAGPSPKRADLVIMFRLGLHLRPATVLATLAKQFKSDIRITCNQKRKSAKSNTSLVSLGAVFGSALTLEAAGEDAELAVHTLAAAIWEGLGETEMGPAPAGAAPAQVPARTEPSTPGVARGIAAAPGIAVGPLYQYRLDEVSLESLDAPASGGLGLEQALAQARLDLSGLRKQKVDQKLAAEAVIFEAQMEILEDLDLIGSVQQRAAGGESAARAWHATLAELAGEIAALGDPVLAGRAADVHDVRRRVLGLMLGTAGQGPALPDHPVVIVARDLSPSVTSGFDSARVLGFITVDGGPTSHVAILARGMGLPAVVGADEAILALPDQTRVILDGGKGTLDTQPDPEAFQRAAEAQKLWQDRRRLALEQAGQSAVTLDGRKVDVSANAGSLKNAEEAMRQHADGIGLLRTEFLFLGERELAPSEEEQYQVYRAIAETMQQRPVIIRTLDIGGDKPVAYLPMAREDNPFLGVRGLRLCLARPDLFRDQLRAILRAARHGSLQIMFPMVSDLSDLKQARAIVEEERIRLDAPQVKLGIMIEVPSAALLADQLAPEVDFFSIGSNDLTQYTLAMDRGNRDLAARQDGLHPAVLRLIAQTAAAAHRHGKRVDLCGELGSDEAAIPILVGLGLDELSVSVKAVPTVKAQVRGLTLAAVQTLACQALDCASAAEVRELVKNFNEI